MVARKGTFLSGSSAAVCALAAAMLISLPAPAADGRLGHTSSAMARIHLVIPEGFGSEGEGSKMENRRGSCLTNTQARAFYRYYGDPATGPEQTEPTLSPETCRPDPNLTNLAGDDLLVLEVV